MANAILMASGMGTRMMPLTKDTPKPLLPVCGKPMVTTVLDGLVAAGVSKIFLVSGYLGEQFEALKASYPNLSIINNPYYESVNNISSVYVARDVLAGDDCFVCEADLYVMREDLFAVHPSYSCYYGVMRPGFSGDWGFETDEAGIITRVGKGVTDCYNMVGVSYLKQREAALVATAVERTFGTPGYETLFWDDVVDSILGELQLRVFPVENSAIAELDTPEELEELERRLNEG